MIEVSPAGRCGTTDEVAHVAAILMGPEGGFSPEAMPLGCWVTAAYWFGEPAPQ